MSELRQALIAFRNASNHSNPLVRQPISDAFLKDENTERVQDVTVYRVSAANDTALRFSDFADTNVFVSCCASRTAADQLLSRPPNPFADKVIELSVTGPIIRMVYDDGAAGARKQAEDEVIVQLKCVASAKILS